VISIIDRYLLKEVLKTLLAVLTVLALILLSNSFIKLLKEVAAGELNTNLLFQLLGLEVTTYISRLMPPAFFFAVLYALGRMYRDSEMVALESCGVGGLRLYRSLSLAVLPVVLLTAWLSLWVTPWSSRMSAELIASQEGQAGELSGIAAGRFNEYSKGDLVLYTASMADKEKRMQDVFIQQRRDGLLNLISAKSGIQQIDERSGDRYLILDDGYRYQGQPGQADYEVSEFKHYALRIQERDPQVVDQHRRSLPNRVLLASMKIEDRAQFQVRLSQMLGLLVFAFLSLPLSRSLPRQGPFGRLVLAFVLYTVYLSLQGLAERWMIEGVTASWLGTWWVHLSLFLVGLIILLPDSQRYRVWRRRLRESGA
jgi:lipopolysaccharide export system permease protein